MTASSLGFSPIRRVLAGKSILLTEASGLIGKVLLEKILRTVPEIGRIYVLVRAQDAEHTPAPTEHDIFSASIFDLLKDCGGFQKLLDTKILFVAGDTSLPRLGLSPKDYMLLTNQLDLVINTSPNSDFMSGLDQAVLRNTHSAKYLSAFVGECMRARLVQLSTCYVNEGIPARVEEKLYSQPQSRRRLPVDGEGRPELEQILVELDREIQKIRERALNAEECTQAMVAAGWNRARSLGWNNISTFSKWLGENFIAQASGKIYVSILRPSISESCLEPPHAGWIEGCKIADPLIYAAVIDHLPYLPADPKCVLDFIPVDLVCNSILALLPELMTRKSHELKIYHSCNGASANHVTLGELNAIVQRKYRSEGKGKPVVFLTRRAWRVARGTLKALSFITAWMPNGKRLHGKISKALQLAETFSPYTYLRSTFANEQMIATHAQLAFEDRELYPVTYGSIKPTDYLTEVHIPGLFRNVLQRPLPQNSKPAPVRLRKVP